MRYQYNYNMRERKQTLLTELYNTGRFKGVDYNPGTKNPIRAYIAGALYKQRMATSPELIGDCYNEVFRHLIEMPTEKFLQTYDESPAKIISIALRIASLKCFAIDPRYNNPRHSLIEGIKFASTLFNERNYLDACDSDTFKSANTISNTDNSGDLDKMYSKVLRHKLSCEQHNPDEFEQKYGFTVEYILDKLNDEERVIFYEMTERQPRGKVAKEKALIRLNVIEKLKHLKHNIAI